MNNPKFSRNDRLTILAQTCSDKQFLVTSQSGWSREKAKQAPRNKPMKCHQSPKPIYTIKAQFIFKKAEVF